MQRHSGNHMVMFEIGFKLVSLVKSCSVQFNYSVELHAAAKLSDQEGINKICSPKTNTIPRTNTFYTHPRFQWSKIRGLIHRVNYMCSDDFGYKTSLGWPGGC